MDKNNSGILVVNKPAGMSSAAVVARVKRLTKAKKVGHTGTLDPFATGVLVCCLNKATRLANFFLNGDKTYQAVLCLGISTDTQDATGNIIDRVTKDIDVSKQRLISVFNRYKGKSRQQPPVYSALKLNGVPLYKLARVGKAVQKPPRPIEISNINIIDVDLPCVQFEVSCSAGTYIRTLCSDIGNDLGYGAHLKELERTSSCGFDLDQAIALDDLEALVKSGNWSGALISMADALSGMPAYVGSKDLIKKIKNGVRLNSKDMELNLKDTQGLIQVIDGNNNLVAILNNENQLPYYSYRCVLI